MRRVDAQNQHGWPRAHARQRTQPLRLPTRRTGATAAAHGRRTASWPTARTRPRTWTRDVGRGDTYALPPWNMTSVAQVAALLASESAPTDLVAFEFSGRVRAALTAAGRAAMSCDRVRSDIEDGWHYQGDAQDIAHMSKCTHFYAFPPCYHQAKSGAAYGTSKSHRTAGGGGAWPNCSGACACPRSSRLWSNRSRF